MKEVSQVQNSIYRVIERIAGEASRELNINSGIIEELGFNSIQYVQLIVDLEDCFNIEFNDEMLMGNDFTIGYIIQQVMNETD